MRKAEIKKRFKELVKYCLAGGVSTGINLLLFWLFERNGMYYITANASSYLIAVVCNYTLNDRLVFQREKKQDISAKAGGFLKFMLIRLLNLLVDSFLFYFCVNIMKIPLYISRLGLTFAGIIITYFLVKKAVFKERI